MLASDLNNMNFTGAMNPDDALWVEFFDDTVLETYKSEQEGRPIYSDVVKIRIRIPGNDTLVIDRAMEPGDKVRFPRQWAVYQSKSEDDAVIGTPLSELPGLRKADIANLRVAGFRTVEQVANASDQVLSAQGMSLGVGGIGLKMRCQQYLNAAADAAPMTQMAAELEKRDAQLAAMEAQMKAMAEMLEKATAPKAEPEAEKPATLSLKKRGESEQA